MEKIVKKIRVRVTYMVGLGDINVPDDILDQLNEIANNGDEVEQDNFKYDKAQQWIIDNIKERDCFEHKFEIVDLRV